MSVLLEPCYLLNITFYLNSFVDLFNLLQVNHKCNVLNMLLINPTFHYNTNDLLSCLKHAQYLQTFNAPLSFLSRHHTFLDNISCFITSCLDMSPMDIIYLQYISKRVTSMELGFSIPFSIDLNTFERLTYIKLNIACDTSDININYSCLKSTVTVHIETIQSNNEYLERIVPLIKGPLILTFVDRLNEIIIAKIRNKKKNVQYCCKSNNLYISLIKNIAFVQPIRYHIPFAIDFIASENFDSVLQRYDIPFIVASKTDIEHEYLQVDISRSLIYSFELPYQQYPQLELLLPTCLCRLSINSKHIQIPLLPNLMELQIGFFETNTLPDLPNTITGLTLIQGFQLTKLLLPTKVKSLVLRELLSLRTLPYFPQTLKYCEIGECPFKLPMFLSLKQLILFNSAPITNFPQTLSILSLSSLNIDIPPLDEIPLIQLTLMDIPLHVTVPSTVTRLQFRDCLDISFPSFISVVSIPFASKLPPLPNMFELQLQGVELPPLPITLTALNLQRCVISNFPNLIHLKKLMLIKCVIHSPFPTLLLTSLTIKGNNIPPLTSTIEYLNISNNSLEEIIIPLNVNELHLSYCNNLTSLTLNNKLMSLNLLSCHSLQPILLPTNISNLDVCDCKQFKPLNINALVNLPFALHLYYSEQTLV